MVEELKFSNYKKLVEENDSIIFVDFYSPSCGPCQILLPFLETLDKHFEDNNVTVLKCDVSKENKIAEKFKVRSVPTTIVIGDDKMVKYYNVGLASAEEYIKEVNKALGVSTGLISLITNLFKKL